MGWGPLPVLCVLRPMSVRGTPVPRIRGGLGQGTLPWHRMEDSLLPGPPNPPHCVLCPCSDLKLRVRILIDGTLIIFRVKPEDAGKYTCVPSNSLGRSPSASAYLTVQCEWARWPCWGWEGGLGEGGRRRGRGEEGVTPRGGLTGAG